ncbi:hypothetical protein GQ54DRAFT_295710 [Martensiomyces pterosporus]|nr:hypothetical protein GQ54DRAFT_295710 [Martensiomyces pterosporus]
MEDIGLALADFVSNLENVPSEIRHLFSEITDLDEKYEEAMSRAYQEERNLQKWLKDRSNREKQAEREEQLIKSIDDEHIKAKAYCQEKIRLTKKAMTIVQRHLAKLDAEIRHYDKTPFDQKRSTTNYNTPTHSSLGTVGIQNGELGSFRLPTPKRFSDSIPSLALENAATEAEGFYTPSRAPKRRHHAGANGAARSIQRHKKQLKLTSSVLSLDGIEIDSGSGGAGGIEESDDQLYCFCQQVSYGDMVACDGVDCRYEWFHWECVGLTSPPKGSWYCSECLAKLLDEEE